MNTDLRWHSPAADRNKDPIARELQRLLPPQGRLLEIASGTGQHAAHLANALPGWQWHPTDADPGALASIAAWCVGQATVQPPVLLDVLDDAWPGVPPEVDAIFCANMLHIAPWGTCAALMAGATRRLSPAGRLILYGPYLLDDAAAAPSNLAFDADLRSRNPAWGLRRLAEVLAEAEAVGLRLNERVEMPANNLLLVLVRAG